MVTVPDTDALNEALAKGTEDDETAAIGFRRIGKTSGSTLFGKSIDAMRAAHHSFFADWMDADITATGYFDTPLAKKLALTTTGSGCGSMPCPKASRTKSANMHSILPVCRQSRRSARCGACLRDEALPIWKTRERLRAHMAPDGHVWVSWPKHASGVPAKSRR